MASLPEIALMGRSNAGKSSLINGWAQRKGLAKVSQTPGKTRTLNFFEVNKRYRLVDLPGYGYARVSGDEQRLWRKMIERYLADREILKGGILIMDIRRPWEEEEEDISNWCRELNRPLAIALTKTDRTKQSERVLAVRAIEKTGWPVFAVSSVTGSGMAQLEDHIFKNWVEPHDSQ